MTFGPSGPTFSDCPGSGIFGDVGRGGGGREREGDDGGERGGEGIMG